ncbi:hypothetical protein [Sphingobacterium sp. UBA5980]|uniref:hypothetical protein n=1 Tax=Sphingobacterium sp. UBA5980 TaxID=1947504 RepID=UPI00257CCCF8|nr:hypothetical protein [Sphingobacterium sp. UBA5980]
MEIRTERLKLRSVEKIDLEKIHSLLMYPESTLFNPSGFPNGIAHTEQMVEAWSAQINELDARKDYTFYIETLEGKSLLG